MDEEKGLYSMYTADVQLRNYSHNYFDIIKDFIGCFQKLEEAPLHGEGAMLNYNAA